LYRCLAKNIGGEDAKNLTVDVQYPPSFVSPPANQEVLIYTSAIFRCVANGNPEPEIQWLKDGVRLTSSDEVYLIGSDMIIPRAQPHHAGMYKCNASNSVGSTSAEATLSCHCFSTRQSNDSCEHLCYFSMYRNWESRTTDPLAERWSKTNKF
jgi:hypothetical protein